ncbi:TatD family hydrolase [Desulfoplanes sp.]
MAKKKQRPMPQSLGLPRTGMDAHAHLDAREFEQDLDGVLSRARESGLDGVATIFLGPKPYMEGAPRFADHRDVVFLMGLHPEGAGTAGPNDIPGMERLFREDPRLRAVGEIGLDYYWDATTKERQKRVFKEQLELARQLGLPVAIHSREAEADTLAILLDMGFHDYPLQWHCFGQSADLARELLSHGWYLSIPGTVTYKKNRVLTEAVRVIPVGRMFVETDCPYLAADPYRGKRNEPALVVFTAQKIAEIKETPVEEIWTACGENARGFFGCPRTGFAEGGP